MPYGLDLSNNQGTPDYRLLINAKPGLVYAKCSQGTVFTDRVFTQTRDVCVRANIPFGAYHFANNGDPVKEAEFFCNLVGKIGKDELRPTLDLETGKPSKAWALAWCGEVQKRLGVTPLLYTYPSYYWALGGWPRQDTWIADLVPPGKSKIPNVLHQYSWHGHEPGVSGDVDLDYTSDLRALLAFPTLPLTKNQLWFLWARWRLGEGEFKDHGKANPAVRPKQLPARIPAGWWVRLAGFLANRKTHGPRGDWSAAAQAVHTNLRSSPRAE